MASTYPSPSALPSANVGNVTAVQVAPQNLSRDQLYVFNPGANVIWVAPITTVAGAANVAIAAGNGSVPIQPLQGFMFPGFKNGMSAIAAAGGTNVLTVWEYYP